MTGTVEIAIEVTAFQAAKIDKHERFLVKYSQVLGSP
jgi:hypothetical protein